MLLLLRQPLLSQAACYTLVVVVRWCDGATYRKLNSAVCVACHYDWRCVECAAHSPNITFSSSSLLLLLSSSSIFFFFSFRFWWNIVLHIASHVGVLMPIDFHAILEWIVFYVYRMVSHLVHAIHTGCSIRTLLCAPRAHINQWSVRAFFIASISCADWKWMKRNWEGSLDEDSERRKKMQNKINIASNFETDANQKKNDISARAIVRVCVCVCMQALKTRRNNTRKMYIHIL